MANLPSTTPRSVPYSSCHTVQLKYMRFSPFPLASWKVVHSFPVEVVLTPPYCPMLMYPSRVALFM